MAAAARRAVAALGALAALAAAGPAASCGGDQDEPGLCEAEALAPVRLLQSELHVARAAHEPRHAGHEQAAARAAPHHHQQPAAPSRAAAARRQRRQPRRQRRARGAYPAAGPAALAEVGLGTTTTESPTGVSENSAGDLTSFLEMGAVYLVLIAIMLVGFSNFRRWYPLVYCKNVTPPFALGSIPDLPDSQWGWWSATRNVDLEVVADNVGLDRAMLLRFADLGMTIMMWIGVPMICIGGTCNYLFGGDAADGDNMSLLSFGNIQYGNWLYYPYSVVVWMVCVLVHKKICAAQAEFLQLRFKWLREMTRVRANTVLVEGIPEEYQRDDLLHDFFGRMFAGDSVADAHCVKDSGDLLVHWKRRAQLRILLREAEAKWEMSGKDPDVRPQHSQSLIGVSMIGGTTVDSIDAYKAELDEIDGKIKEEQEKLAEDAKTVGGVNLSTGFVTFKDRSFAEIALAVNISADSDVWVVENPPSPVDIMWGDLKQDPTARAGREFIGFMLVAGLYMAYLPLVILITNLADLITFPGVLDDLWSCFAPTMGLQFMVAFLPTFLRIIFENFFTLKAEAWMQYKIQVWYFWFNVVFVLMIAAVGTDFFTFADALLTSPFSIFSLLGDSLPYATHYYCNYIVLNWFTHHLNLTRYVQYSKFKAFSALFSEEEAATMCEPEDQDYYGIGSRSARFTTLLCIGIVYGTMSPPVNLLTWVNFYICRIVYGYTMVYAERKKPDLGGVFWSTQLAHIYVGLMIYVVCMTGVFYCRVHPEATIVEDSDELEKADLSISPPVVVSALAIPYVIWARRKFEESYNWERLPFSVVFQQKDEASMKRQAAGNYLQPECLPEELEDADVFGSSQLASHQAALKAGLSGAAAKAAALPGLGGISGR